MPTTADFKRGLRVELEGEPYVIVEYNTQSASARGGNTLVRAKLRNIKSGQLVERSFKSGERVKSPDFEIRTAQYLYEEGGETFYFMDNETYEQFPLKRGDLEEELLYLRPNDEVRALIFNGACIGIELPQTLVMEVVETEPGVRGDTVNAVTKPATLETGLIVQVPLFVDRGEKIVVDTRDARYVRRA